MRAKVSRLSAKASSTIPFDPPLTINGGVVAGSAQRICWRIHQLVLLVSTPAALPSVALLPSMVMGLPELPLFRRIKLDVIVEQRKAVSPGPIFPTCFGLAQLLEVLNQEADRGLLQDVPVPVPLSDI